MEGLLREGCVGGVSGAREDSDGDGGEERGEEGVEVAGGNGVVGGCVVPVFLRLSLGVSSDMMRGHGKLTRSFLDSSVLSSSAGASATPSELPARMSETMPPASSWSSSPPDSPARYSVSMCSSRFSCTAPEIPSPLASAIFLLLASFRGFSFLSSCGANSGILISTTLNSPSEFSEPNTATTTPVTKSIGANFAPVNFSLPDSSSSII